MLLRMSSVCVAPGFPSERGGSVPFCGGGGQGGVGEGARRHERGVAKVPRGARCARDGARGGPLGVAVVRAREAGRADWIPN